MRHSLSSFDPEFSLMGSSFQQIPELGEGALAE